MEKLLLDMMNSGFCLVLSDGKYVLSKISIGDQVQDFASLEEALQTVKKMFEPETWKMEMMYKHRGYRNPRYEYLGNFTGSFEEAETEAARLTQLFFEREKVGDYLESWQAHVEPVR